MAKKNKPEETKFNNVYEFESVIVNRMERLEYEIMENNRLLEGIEDALRSIRDFLKCS